MALTFTSLVSLSSITDATSYVTGSASPSANALLIAVLQTERTTSSPTNPTVTGWSLTWETPGGMALNWLGSGSTRETIRYRVAKTTSAPGSGTLTADFAGVTHIGIEVSIIEVLGADLSGTATQALVEQSTGLYGANVSAASGTSVSSTLISPANAANRPFAAVAHSANEAITHRTNWTELHDIAHGSPVSSLETQYRADAFETTASATWTTSTFNGIVACEVKAATADTIRVGSIPL